MAEANREEAERACRRAEEHFLAGNVAAARRLAGKAQRLYPPLPGVANAVAAYAIHAAAPDWHAVLGVDRSASADAVKKQFRRLSLLVHPDKNHCAAAEGAFKLLGEACDAFSSGAAHGPYATDAASAQEWFRSHHSTPAKPPPESSRPATHVYVRCDHCRADTEVKRSELSNGLVRCLQCHSVLPDPSMPTFPFPSMPTYAWPSPGSYYQGPTNTPPPPPSPPQKKKKPQPPPPWKKKKPQPPSPPPQKKNKPQPPPPPPRPPRFRCPARCPGCETQFTSMVPTGCWLLQCKNCLKRAIVHVKGPDAATCN